MQGLLLLLSLILLPGAEAGKIIGGQEARPHSRPYMAYLQVQSPEGRHSCGGFLVREDFVMTAAHCWGSLINVTLGAHNILRQERTQQHITVLRAIPHPDYNPLIIQNDIMLLQLRNRVRTNEMVSPVALPQDEERLQPGTLCSVAGWGLVNRDRSANRLQEVALRVQEGQACSLRFRTYTSQSEICVGNPEERKNAFRGDSGGPLVCNNRAQGIVSYGDRRGTPPAVFTRIASFLSWINRTMELFKPQDQTEIPYD